jgi:hypothetical protein
LKSLVSIVLLSGLILAYSHRALAADAKNDPSQFPLAVHVSASAYAPSPSYDSLYGPFNKFSQIVTADINGKHCQLYGPTFTGPKAPGGLYGGNGLLNLGDYHARLITDEHKTSYESVQEFEILFPDGAMRRFSVISQSE